MICRRDERRKKAQMRFPVLGLKLEPGRTYPMERYLGPPQGDKRVPGARLGERGNCSVD